MLWSTVLALICLALLRLAERGRLCCDSAEHVLWYSWPRVAADPIALNPIRRAAKAWR